MNIQLESLIEEAVSREDNPMPQMAATVIGEDTVICGDVTTQSDLTIHGTVEGNVRCTGTVAVCGTVHGNVDSSVICMERGKITGNVTATERLTTARDTSIVGNVTARDAELAGCVEGNIIVQGELELSATALVTGDVKAGSVAVWAGAKLNGRMETNATAETIPATEDTPAQTETAPAAAPRRGRPRKKPQKPAATEEAAPQAEEAADEGNAEAAQ